MRQRGAFDGDQHQPLFERDVPALITYQVTHRQAISSKITSEEVAKLIDVGAALHQLSIATDLSEKERQVLVLALKRLRGGSSAVCQSSASVNKFALADPVQALQRASNLRPDYPSLTTRIILV